MRGEGEAAEILRVRKTLDARDQIEQIARCALDAWWFTQQLHEKWWEHCASTIKLSMIVLEALCEHYEMPDDKMIALCKREVVPSPLTAAAVRIATRERDASIAAAMSPARWPHGANVADFWTSTDWPMQLFDALGPLGVPPARRASLFCAVLRPVLARVPGSNDSAHQALAAAEAGCSATRAYELALRVMIDAHSTCTAIERGELPLPSIAEERRPLAIGAMWTILSACAVTVLERVGLEVPTTIAPMVVVASIALDPRAPVERPTESAEMDRVHSATIAAQIRAALPCDELVAYADAKRGGPLEPSSDDVR